MEFIILPPKHIFLQYFSCFWIISQPYLMAKSETGVILNSFSHDPYIKEQKTNKKNHLLSVCYICQYYHIKYLILNTLSIKYFPNHCHIILTHILLSVIRTQWDRNSNDLLYRWKNWSIKKMSNLLKFTQLSSERARTKT